jgi:RNA 3'-terminal phosphate cyclase (ATP)
LVPLMLAPASSSLTLEGGTHNPFAPPFEFLASCFLPIVNRMGPKVEARLERHGFYPAGGGRFTVAVTPAASLTPVDLLDRPGAVAVSARALVADVPASVARREIAAIRRRLNPADEACRIEELDGGEGPGNVVLITLASDGLCEIVSGFGEKGVSAESVANRAIDEARAYIAAGVPVGRHLADQLLLPLAVAGGGSFRTLAPTAHTHTNAEVIGRFLSVRIGIEQEASDVHRVTIVRTDSAQGDG